MGTQRKNVASYNHPQKDYFPTERSNQTVVQILKTRDVHLSARGAAENGLGILQLYRAYWPEQGLLSTIKQAIAFHASSAPEKLRQIKDHIVADSTDTTYNNQKMPFFLSGFSAFRFLLLILRNIPIKYKGHSI